MVVAASERDAWIPIARSFETLHGGTRVELVEGPNETDLRENLYTAALLAEDDVFDLVSMDVTWTAKLAAAGWLTPLDSAFPPEAPLTCSRKTSPRVATPVASIASPSARTWAFSTTAATCSSSANLEPPSTFEELLRAARRYSLRRVSGATCGRARNTRALSATTSKCSMATGASGSRRRSLEVGLDERPALAALDFLRACRMGPQPISPPGVTTYKEEESRRLFQDGRAVFLRSWPYAWRLAQAPGSPIAGRIGVLPMPHAGGRQGGGALGGWGLGVSRFSRHPELAIAFIRHAVALPSQRALCLQSGYAPARLAAYRDPALLASDPFLSRPAGAAPRRGAPPAGATLRPGLRHPPAPSERGALRPRLAGRSPRERRARDAPSARIRPRGLGGGEDALKAASTPRGRALFLIPAALLVAAVVAAPILRVVELSFERVELGDGAVRSWAGLSAYQRLWADSRWWAALRNTLIFTGASTILDTVLGLVIALVLHQRFRGSGALRAAVMLPWALPTSIMALAWVWIFNDSFGVANDLLGRLGVIDGPVAWLGQPRTAMASLILADVWKTTPFVALILLAGLQGIPEGVVEAARLDGLGAWARLRRIVLPLLLPSILAAALFRAVQAYGAFDIVYVMTGGGPGGATETVSLYAFQNYFRYLDFGYGSAIATQSTIFAALLAWIVIRAAGPGIEARRTG